MDELLESWTRSLRARARSERTIKSYVADLTSLSAWLDASGTALDAAERRDLDGFLADRREAGKAPGARVESQRGLDGGPSFGLGDVAAVRPVVHRRGREVEVARQPGLRASH